jgi:hypothetical protein
LINPNEWVTHIIIIIINKKYVSIKVIIMSINSIFNQ